MKLIFLDFDGVLNSLKFMQRSTTRRDICTEHDIDPDAVKRLVNLVEDTGSYVVVSSAWRKVRTLPQLQRILLHHGLEPHRVIGVTLSLGTERGDEIRFFVNTWNMIGDPIESFVILDDSDDMCELTHRLVLTKWETGLLDKHVDAAKNILLNMKWDPDVELL